MKRRSFFATIAAALGVAKAKPDLPLPKAKSASNFLYGLEAQIRAKSAPRFIVSGLIPRNTVYFLKTDNFRFPLTVRRDATSQEESA